MSAIDNNPRGYAPWSWYNVKVSVTHKPSTSETIKVQAKNEGMAGFLAMRKSSICEQYGCGQVDSVEKINNKVAS